MNKVTTSVVKRGKKWQGIVRVKLNGKWKQAETRSGFNKKIDAKTWAIGAANEWKKKTFTGFEDITIGQLKHIFLETKKREVRLHSYHTYRALNNYDFLNDVKLKDLNPLHYNDFVDHIETYNQLRLYRTLFNFGIKHLRLDFYNPVAGIKVDTDKKERMVLTVDEFEREFMPLLEVYKYRIACEVLFYTGLRISELLGLTILDVKKYELNVNKQYQERFKKFSPPKSKNGYRVVPLKKEVYYDLIQFYNRFKTRSFDGRIFYMDRFDDALRQYIRHRTKRTKFKGITPHVFRHSFATNLILNGLDFKTTAEILGDNIQTVMSIYSHVNTDMKKRAHKIINNL